MKRHGRTRSSVPGILCLLIIGVMLVGGWSTLAAAASVTRTAYSPPIPFGPPLSARALASQDLRFKSLHPGHRVIGAFQATRVAMKSLIDPAHVSSSAYIVAVRFGRISRTRSPITTYDHHLVWVVEVSGVAKCSPCSAAQSLLASYAVIDGLTGQTLLSFQAAQ